MDFILSLKMRRLAFFSTLTVVWVHSFNLDERYLWPGYSLAGQFTINNFIQLLICNGLFRFAIPLFFAISGYMMAEREGRLSYLNMVGKRAKMLLGPYFAWAALGLLFTYLWEIVPSLNPITDMSHLRPFGDKHLHEFGMTDWIESLTIFPISFQLWFLRSLFIYSILYPVLAKIIEKQPIVYFIVAGIMMIGSLDLFVLGGDGLFYFGLGIIIRKKNIDTSKLPAFLYSPYFILLASILPFFNTSLAFVSAEWIMPVSYFSFKAMQPILLIAIWTSYDRIVKSTEINWFDNLSATNFFIYGAHVPAVYFITDLIFTHFGRSEELRFVVFISLPLVVITVSGSIGLILKKHWPWIFGLLSGWRKYNFQSHRA